MWIVRLALRRPYTFVVMALLIGVLGTLAALTMSTDIFPNINIPVVSVIWTYGGLAPDEMQNRIATIVERTITTTVNDIEHMESQSIRGTSVIKIYFQPGAKIEAAVAQVNAICETMVKPLPPGITPPLILQYNASSVPVLLVNISSETMPEQELNDLGNNFIRTRLVTVQGASIPGPYGGKSRQVRVDLDPEALYAKGLSPQDVTNAILASNVILPAGTAKMGRREYDIALNGSPQVLDDLNNIPIKYVNGAMVYVRDVAYAHDGFAPQINLVRQDGRHSVMMSILKSGTASTLNVVRDIKKLMPLVQAGLPKGMKAGFLFDQSIYVTASIDGVLREGAVAAVLTALMILVFLGSWRSTIIVATSIPLSILVSILVMRALNQTLNVMTLGGLALAVGILVDDATVEIENVHRMMALEPNRRLHDVILDAAQQIAVPAFVSTLSICIVFVPVFFLTGATGFLFSPLAMAVVFAMMASYLLSRTLVPTMVLFMLPAEMHLSAPAQEAGSHRGWLERYHDRFEHGFDRFHDWYQGLLDKALDHPKLMMTVFLGFAGVSFALLPYEGRDFFPSVDAGQLRLHVRTPPGTRIEQTEVYFQQVEDLIRTIIPAEETSVVLDNIGTPGGMNLALTDSATISAADGEILVALKPEHRPTAEYLADLRAKLPSQFPEFTFFFQPADIVSQILNFGLPAPIDVQVSGPIQDQDANYQVAQEMASKLAEIPGAVDVHVHQVLDAPRIFMDVDRTMAQQAGLTQQNVASSLLVSLTGSGATQTNFWLNPKNGVSYQVTAQTPQYKIDSLEDLNNIPVVVPGLAAPQLLGNLATSVRARTPLVLNHYNVQPVFDVYAGVQGTDLGSVSDRVRQIVEEYQKKVSKATTISVRGQVQSMDSAFFGLAAGIAFAILLVYLLMVVNFQSWTDPVIILTALPGALAGILWILFATRTTISVPSLMGCIMCIGVATSNSILMIAFANGRRQEGQDARSAALTAGCTRLRPVLMTALAMLIGMLPMSLGLGEGGEQNAPLGRAVIGGLSVATFYTLFFVPIAYSVMRRRQPKVYD
jgi:CzcA family heavy metal efflux pump